MTSIKNTLNKRGPSLLKYLFRKVGKVNKGKKLARLLSNTDAQISNNINDWTKKIC